MHIQRIIPKLISCLTVVSLTITLAGCSGKKEKDIYELTPADYEPPYYLTEEELPEDAFYIVKTVTVKAKDKKGHTIMTEETHYLPLLNAATTYGETRQEPTGYDPARITWVNYNLDEGLIPTMYAKDRLIYKSSTLIPIKYSLEKFFDDGYTFGVCGLFQDLSGNYKYESHEKDGKGWTMPTSNATGFDGLEAESIYLAAIGDMKVTPLNVSTSGTITGLELMGTYPCDIRTGTEKVAADLICNVHSFSSAESYMFGDFIFLTDIIAEINVPDYVTNGYYNINGKGFFRYVADEKISDWEKLDRSDFNSTIYTYDKDGNINGTTIGLIFDQNNFLVRAYTAEDENGDSTEGPRVYSYEESVKNKKTRENISNPTERIPSEDGIYSGEYTVRKISEPMIAGSAKAYNLVAEAGDIKETLDFRYIKTASRMELERGHTYYLTFKEAEGTYDGYEILSAAEPAVVSKNAISSALSEGLKDAIQDSRYRERIIELISDNNVRSLLEPD